MSSFFSKLKLLLFPIEANEYKKFFPMALMIFSILFNYTILRNMKDTLVVNASGAGLITFLKLYCVTPAALLFITGYVKLTSVFSRENVFYILVSSFLAFFLAFAFIIYPNFDAFHPSAESIASMTAHYPRLGGFIDIYGYWSYSLFYVLAELWGSVAVQVLFWQFANQIIKMDQAKRFYPLFTSLGNLSLIVCGFLAVYLSSLTMSKFSSSSEAWEYSLKIQISLVVFMGFVAMGSYKFINKFALTNEFASEQESSKTKKKKPGLKESFKMIANSKHLTLIAILVLAYGITINFVEVQWKNQLKIYFAGNKQGFNAFMNQYSQWTGVSVVLFSWLAGSGILKKLSWFTSAVITPLIILLFGSFFFISIFSKNFILSIGLQPITVASFLGAGIVIISKVVKYALFDSTKEMAYIPLDNELKTKGKAAVEVIGGRLGKAGGAFTQNILLIAFGTKNVLEIVSPVFIIFIIIALLWIHAVKNLSLELKKISK